VEVLARQLQEDPALMHGGWVRGQHTDYLTHQRWSVSGYVDKDLLQVRTRQHVGGWGVGTGVH
jgi:hypothetical protein